MHLLICMALTLKLMSFHSWVDSSARYSVFMELVICRESNLNSSRSGDLDVLGMIIVGVLMFIFSPTRTEEGWISATLKPKNAWKFIQVSFNLRVPSIMVMFCLQTLNTLKIRVLFFNLIFKTLSCQMTLSFHSH